MNPFNKSEIQKMTSKHILIYWFVVAVYVTLCTILNQPTFQAFANDVYFYGTLLALAMSIIEMKLAQQTAKAIVE